jgi:hypothetical protein
VPGHDQTNGRGRLLAWSLLALVALAATISIRAADPPPPDDTFSLDDPITLAADNVRYWDFQNEQWIVLEGRAAVLSGVEGIRADRAVARIRSVVISGDQGYQLQVYAEGNVTDTGRKGPPARDLRRLVATKKTVDLKAYTAKGRVAGKGVPTDLKLVNRAFPEVKASSAAENRAGPQAMLPPLPARRALPSTSPTDSLKPNASRGGGAADSTMNPNPKPAPRTSDVETKSPIILSPTPPSADAASSAAVDPFATVSTVASDPPNSTLATAPVAALPQAKPKVDSQIERAQAQMPAIGDRAGDAVVPAPRTNERPALDQPEVAPLPLSLPLPAATSGAPPVLAARDDPAPKPAPARPAGAGFPDGPGLSDPSADPFPPIPGAVRDAPPAAEAPPAPPGAAGDDPVRPQDRPATPFPMPGDFPPPAPVTELPLEREAPPQLMPVSPTALRTWSISPRAGGENSFQIRSFESADGTITIIAKGGVTLISDVPGKGTVDISADSAVIWTKRDPSGRPLAKNENEEFVQQAAAPLEVYLEGNVLIRNDARQYAGNSDAKVFQAPQAYYDFRTERMTAPDADVSLYAPGLITPLKMRAKEMNQYRPMIRQPDGTMALGLAVIQGERTTTTGSRFPNPGYRFNSTSIDLYQLNGAALDPNSGIPVGRYRDPLKIGRKTPENKWRRFFGFPEVAPGPDEPPVGDVYRIDARQNVFYNGPVPFFYWPRFLTDSDDLDPVLRMLTFSYVQYFGYEFRADVNAFKLFGLRKPANVDSWNIDADYLSRRGPALGSEIGWFGTKIRGLTDGPYNGYFDIYGIHDNLGKDTLGPGPAVITDGPPKVDRNPAFTRLDVPFFDKFRGRAMVRHMQSFLNSTTAADDEELRLQLEAGYLSDRNFLEQYYKRLFDSGLDQSTDAYFIKQNQNRAFTVLGSVNLQDWYTDTQFLPKLEYYRFGDSLLGGMFNYSTDSGIDYANVHTAVEVNNKNLFTLPATGQSAFIPYDPVSNTSGPWGSSRAFTAHQIDMPINLDVIRFVPYAQGQLAAWDNQLDGSAVGRAWGAFGARANVSAFRNFPEIQNDLLNVNGLSHKISFDADARFAYSNVNLNQIGIQDQLDDNTYEWGRRYFALTNYVGGLLPLQYDPRFLTLRRAVSPIAGTTDVQGTVDTIKLGIHQRLQTKRGPIGKQRIIDWMVFDLQTTYFPNSARDNFGKPFGQNTYNWEWFVGDRTSIISTGWFEFFDVTGRPVINGQPRRANDPLTFDVINTGISISRPPRGNIYIGYSVINTGPIATSALSTSFSYLLSPKWYSTFTTVYDFGNGILLSASGTVTRVGADWLTSFGVVFSPLQKASSFSLEMTPRLSPNMRFGSSNSATRFDPRFAPTQ